MTGDSAQSVSKAQMGQRPNGPPSNPQMGRVNKEICITKFKAHNNSLWHFTVYLNLISIFYEV